MIKTTALAALAACCSAEVFYQETFDNEWSDRWVQSDWKKDEGTRGDFEHTAGPHYGDAEASKGIMTGPDARFFATSSKLSSEFSSVGKPLVLQFQVRYTQKPDCGGAYIKVLPSGVDQASFSGDSPYNIMFGPDICGTSTKRVHAIFNYKGDNKLIKKTVACETDTLSHVYTLVVNPDQTYEIRIDGTVKESGSMIEDWDFLPAKMIKDPEQSKPEDWVDDAMIDDPEDIKPADYDDIPEQIVDPEAEKPEDWDDEMDGDWEAPMLENPEFKGEFKVKRISNPEYKGQWEHPEIENPEFELDATIGQYESNAAVGFELWQVKAGSIFDNIIVTDSVEEAETFMAETFTAYQEQEKAMFTAAEDEKRAEEKAQREKDDAERAAAEVEEEDEDEDEDEEEEAPAAAHEDL